jgi:hypothetical protein
MLGSLLTSQGNKENPSATAGFAATGSQLLRSKLSAMHKFGSADPGAESNMTSKPRRFEDPEKEGGEQARATMRVLAGDDALPLRTVAVPCQIGRRDPQLKATAPSPHNLCFDSPFLSRKHAELVSLGQGNVALRDLGSSNGTFLNGLQLVPMRLVRLHDGDLVQFGTEDATQGIQGLLIVWRIDSVVICQFGSSASVNAGPVGSGMTEATGKGRGGTQRKSPTGTMISGPLSKVGDISRRLASLGLLLNGHFASGHQGRDNASNGPVVLDSDTLRSLQDTLDTIEQLLEQFDPSAEDNAGRRLGEHTVHTRPSIGEAMRIVHTYETAFCLLAVLLVLFVCYTRWLL